ncbi:MAG: hypothetical protein HKN28_10645 [Alphaproteobacteria bacterium]|nr:hypothetical protein [Alphaproteobacteria bacterium]
MTMNELPASVRTLFKTAGWHPGRNTTVSTKILTTHPAAIVLAEFGGLKVGEAGDGEECAKDDVNFHEIWPVNSIIPIWSKLLSKELIGITEVHNGHCEMYIDDTGRCFGLSLIHDAFYFEGDSFSEAIENMLLGRRSRPMLRPDQKSVGLYGETFTAEHAAVYRY